MQVGMAGNSNLHDSSRNKQDEFYTNLQLVEDELKHYRAHFKGKRVLCNCDDPYERYRLIHSLNRGVPQISTEERFAILLQMMCLMSVQLEGTGFSRLMMT